MDKKKRFIQIVLFILLVCACIHVYIVTEYKNKPNNNQDSDNNVIIDVIDDIKDKIESDYVVYHFRNDELLISHYEKHGIEMGFDSADDYEKAACDVINNVDALHKKEKEDNDDVYYIEDTKEFVVLSTDGYIRTYFTASKKYFDKQ